MDGKGAKFWLVWSPLQGSPTVMHKYRSDAVLEVRRLASKHNGKIFYLLEADEAFVVERPVTKIKLTEHEVPF